MVAVHDYITSSIPVLFDRALSMLDCCNPRQGPKKARAFVPTAPSELVEVKLHIVKHGDSVTLWLCRNTHCTLS